MIFLTFCKKHLVFSIISITFEIIELLYTKKQIHLSISFFYFTKHIKIMKKTYFLTLLAFMLYPLLQLSAQACPPPPVPVH